MWSHIILLFAFTSSLAAYSGTPPPRSNVHSLNHFIDGATAMELFNAIQSDGSVSGRTRWEGTKSLLNGKVFCIYAVDVYACKIRSRLTQTELEHVYKHLDVKYIETNVPDRNVKIIGDLIFMPHHIFFTNPCKGVDSLNKAKKCLDFWAHKIYSESERGNTSYVVVTNDYTQNYLLNVMTANGATRRAIGDAVTAVSSSRYLGLMAILGREIEVLYFSLDNNNVMRPTEVFSIKTAKTKRWRVEQLFGEQGMTWEEINNAYACAVLLGADPNSDTRLQQVLNDIAPHLKLQTRPVERPSN